MTALLAAGAVLGAWGTAIALTGGLQFTLLGLRISSRDPFRPCVLGAICALVFAWQQRRQPVTRQPSSPRAYAIGAGEIALGFAVVAATYGSFVAGGSDSYGYISQADLWRSGDLRIEQPWAATLPWPDADRIASPAGYRPGLAPHTIVPTYPAGFPLLIAAAKLVGAQAFVVPLLAGLMIWLTYLIGSESSDERLTGLVAAAVIATSPVFVHQSMWAMADVPAATFWTLALWLGAIRSRPLPAMAGVCAGIALMIRPNLVLLTVAIPFVWWWFGERAWRKTALFVAGLLPFVAAIGSINQFLYGAPWITGYGEIAGLFGWENVIPNLRSYYAWMADTQTVLFLPAMVLGAVFALKRNPSGHMRRFGIVCAVMIGATLLSYLFYQPFVIWWYLRFLLPVWPFAAVAVASVIAFATHRIGSLSERRLATALLCAPLVMS